MCLSIPGSRLRAHAVMIPVYLWGWTSAPRNVAMMKELETLQHEGRFKMPQICELKPLNFTNLATSLTARIAEAQGNPNLHIVLIHPNFQAHYITNIKEIFERVLRVAAFHSKTFIIFCDTTGSHPTTNVANCSSDQINKTLRRLTTQYALNSYYLDLHQVLQPRDWTPKLNIHVSGQVKLGRAIAKAISGTPSEVFRFD